MPARALHSNSEIGSSRVAPGVLLDELSVYRSHQLVVDS